MVKLMYDHKTGTRETTIKDVNLTMLLSETTMCIGGLYESIKKYTDKFIAKKAIDSLANALKDEIYLPEDQRENKNESGVNSAILEIIKLLSDGDDE